MFIHQGQQEKTRVDWDSGSTTMEYSPIKVGMKYDLYISGQITIFHQPRFPWNKGNSLTKPPFGMRSCEVAIIWPDIYIYISIKFGEGSSK